MVIEKGRIKSCIVSLWKRCSWDQLLNGPIIHLLGIVYSKRLTITIVKTGGESFAGNAPSLTYLNRFRTASLEDLVSPRLALLRARALHRFFSPRSVLSPRKYFSAADCTCECQCELLSTVLVRCDMWWYRYFTGISAFAEM